MERRIPFWLMLLLGLLLYQEGLATYSWSEDVLEMKVRGVAMDPYGNTPMVILEDAEGHEAFPIWIGLSEAQAIARALEGIPTPRPMTHVLLQNILGNLQVEVARIVINNLQHNTFYASVFLRQGAKKVTIDARPSDAIALALGVKAPIFVSKKILSSIRTVTLSVPASSPARKFGMHLQSLDENLAGAFRLASTEGVLVAFVEVGSEAESHGMQRGDVITDVDGRHINNLQDLLEIVAAKKAGQELLLQVIRDRQARTIRLSAASIE